MADAIGGWSPRLRRKRRLGKRSCTSISTASRFIRGTTAHRTRRSSSRTTAGCTDRQTPGAATPGGARAACSPVNLQVQWQSLNRGYEVTQFYHGAPFPDGTRYLGGTQDNGTILGSRRHRHRRLARRSRRRRRPRRDRSEQHSDLLRRIAVGEHRENDEWRRAVHLAPHRPRCCALGRARAGGELPVRHAVRDGSRRTRSGCGWAASTSIARTTARRCGPRPARCCPQVD